MNQPVVVDQVAWDIGRLAQRLMEEYYTHMAALHVAADPRAAALAPPLEPGHAVSVLQVPRDDGTYHTFWFDHFLGQVREPQLVEDFKRAWLASALLTVGDALGAAHYFKRAPEAEPEAELVRHLRNGIAHGNKFSMRGDVIDPTTGRLKLPAHNRRYAGVLGMREYEIDVHLNGSVVLFDYGGPAAILDILMVLGWHLTRTGSGFAAGTA
ncbi:hypothetical protein ACQR1Y_11635 [Bradyrhizobium sp. HKCCYLRH3099]|uniref:hypothetical protein n=1 Tax=unclassified Bradyrhizobium TaxID=2631580 RepID=UPI003EB7EA21